MKNIASEFVILEKWYCWLYEQVNIILRVEIVTYIPPNEFGTITYIYINLETTCV